MKWITYLLILIFVSSVVYATCEKSSYIENVCSNVYERETIEECNKNDCRNITRHTGNFTTVCNDETYNRILCTAEINKEVQANVLNKIYSFYDYSVEDAKYKAYFRNNSNTGEPVRYEKDGYYFIYDVSGSQMRYREQPGFPDRTDTLGNGMTSNSQNTKATLNGNIIQYTNAFTLTNITYNLSSKTVKEVFILGQLPSFKNYTYLEYTGNIKFNKTLQICANNQCYTPSGTQDDFTTQGQIDFRDMNNKTIFYLQEPIITDSNGTQVLGRYDVKGSNAQMNFNLQIPISFLQTAAYPVFIDPTILINRTTDIHLDLYEQPGIFAETSNELFLLVGGVYDFCV
jgi:hypothetical protein